MKEQILQWCEQLSASQGFYGRLLEELKNNEEELNALAEMQFEDIIDFIMFVES